MRESAARHGPRTAGAERLALLHARPGPRMHSRQRGRLLLSVAAGADRRRAARRGWGAMAKRACALRGLRCI